MNYTVKAVAILSGITVRTLQYYDEIGLLKPAFIGENNYRYYQEEELLKLQQILFFKELGLSLQQVKDIVNTKDFNTLEVLRLHTTEVQRRIEHLNRLLTTIDKTIDYLEGKHSLDTKDMFYGFKNNSSTMKKSWVNASVKKTKPIPQTKNVLRNRKKR